MEKKGELIVVEGIDGCGKTSHSKRLAEFLDAEWRRFPNRDTPFGKLIDEHLKEIWKVRAWGGISDEERKNPDVTAWGLRDALVFQAIQIANRVECANDFRDTLALGLDIVCDRYWPSGYAFGGADGLNKEYMVQIHEGLLQPDLLILFDVEVEEAVKRMDARQRDRYEQDTALQHTVAANYRELWERMKDDLKWVKINANGSPEETWELLLAAVRAHKERS